MRINLFEGSVYHHWTVCLSLFACCLAVEDCNRLRYPIKDYLYLILFFCYKGLSVMSDEKLGKSCQ